MLVQAGADLLANDSLTTTVLLCLFTDRRAEVSDRLPDGGHDRRGWWANSYRDRPVGSRLWLLSREKELPAVLVRAEAYTDEALRGLLNAGMISQIALPGECAAAGLAAADRGPDRSRTAVCARLPLKPVWRGCKCRIRYPRSASLSARRSRMWRNAYRGATGPGQSAGCRGDGEAGLVGAGA